MLELVLLACALPVAAQVKNPTRHASPLGYSYAKEESSTDTSVLHVKEQELRAALETQPQSASLLYGLALVQRQENQPRASLVTYTRAAKLRNPTPLELRSVALNYVLLNDYDDAIHWLEIAASVAPSDPDILYALGRCYYTRSRYVDAEKMYKRVLAIDAHHIKAEENLGLVYDALDRPPLAEAALRQAANWANPQGRDEWPFLDLGSFLLDHDRAKEAIEPLQSAERIQPGAYTPHERLGRAMLQAGQSTAGINELEQAEKIKPRDPKIHFELGRALRQAGMLEQAKKEMELSQKLYSTHSEE